MKKSCVICGALFDAPPSSKKITCSPECSARRKSDTHAGRSTPWAAEARERLSKSLRARGFADNANLQRAHAAAMALPEGQRGPQNRGAKIWVLIAPDGTRHRIVNLLDWGRKHAEWFDVVKDDADRERVARNIRTGFAKIVQARLGRAKRPCYTYKGWALGDWPRAKKE